MKKNNPNKSAAPKRARPVEDVMTDIQLQLPELAEHFYMDREWLWFCGPSLQGEHNKPKRELLKVFGFRFAPGGHLMPDGETKGFWGHCCELPLARRRRPNVSSETEESVVPDFASLGL